MTTKEALDIFCKTINGDKPVLVPLDPRPWAKENRCFDNVGQMVEEFGGRDRPGWMFAHRPFGNGPGIFIAIHHCIWESHEGKMIDVTPPSPRMLTCDNRIWFLRDDAATQPQPYGAAFGIPRPNKIFTLSQNAGVKKLVHCLRRQEMVDWEKRKEFARVASAARKALDGE